MPRRPNIIGKGEGLDIDAPERGCTFPTKCVHCKKLQNVHNSFIFPTHPPGSDRVLAAPAKGWLTPKMPTEKHPLSKSGEGTFGEIGWCTGALGVAVRCQSRKQAKREWNPTIPRRACVCLQYHKFTCYVIRNKLGSQRNHSVFCISVFFHDVRCIVVTNAHEAPKDLIPFADIAPSITRCKNNKMTAS